MFEGSEDLADWLDHPPEEGTEVAPGESRRLDWLRSVFRFTRPDGSIIFGPRGRSKPRLAELERWVDRLRDPALTRVIRWWRPSRRSDDDEDDGDCTAPPLPTATWLDRPLAVLRPDWTPRGDCVAIDHRAAGTASTIEVAGRGVTWLGPSWTAPTLAGVVAPAKATFGTSGPFADAYEWSFGVGPLVVTRSAILVRGAGLALLLQNEVGVGDGLGEARWSLPAGLEARPDPALRALILSSGPGRPQARLIPLGLPESPYPTDRGALVAEGREVVLRQATTGPNRCLALLVAWNKQPPRGWRTLTVAEKSAACPPGTAFAARVGWGSGRNGLLVYRSLAPSALRSVLGHQTKLRLLVAGFTPTGEVHPWIKATDPAPLDGDPGRQGVGEAPR